MRKGSTGSSTTCKSGHNETLIIAPSWLGDAVMATPLLAVCRRRFPGSTITVACKPYVSGIFARSGAADRLLEYPAPGVRARIGTVRGSRPPGGYDACIVMPPSFSSALVGFASGARRRIGYGGQWRSMLLTDVLPAANYRRGHLSGAYLGLLERLAGEPVDEPQPAIVPPGDWAERGPAIAGAARYCVLAPGATYGGAKMWPHGRFAELARRLWAERGIAAVVVGSAAERDGAQRILAAAEVPGANRAGELSLDDLMCVMRGARLVVGNDSGPVHVAAALGAPTVAVFGPTSVEWTAPRGPAVRVVAAGAECSPCFERECPLGTPECLERVGVGDVLDAAASLWEGA